MKRFEELIANAIEDAASDIHITGGHPVVLRRHGEIRFSKKEKWKAQEIDEFLRQILTPFQRDTLKNRKSVDIAYTVNNARLRINVFATLRGTSMAIRVLPAAIPTIENLNLHPSLKDISGFKSGLVLCCGPTGVGKTTTIAAIIDDINSRRQVHVITLENPIEYRFLSKKSFIQQRELGNHVPSMAQGMLDVLRENPDVIVVGEMRKAETMQLTISAAESGHLVIASLHASNPEEAIYRLCNSVPHEAQEEIRYQLSLSLVMIITQQLVYLDRVGFRVPLLSIVRGTSSVKNLIRENKLNQLNGVIQMSRNEGMFTTERYMSEYIAGRERFFNYTRAFKPPAEPTRALAGRPAAVEDAAAPLRQNGVPVPDALMQPPKATEHMATGEVTVTIDGDDPLDDVVESLKGYTG